MPTSVLLPEGELRVARCDTLDKLIAVGDGDAALLYLYILRHGGTVDGKAAARALHLSAERYVRAAFYPKPAHRSSRTAKRGQARCGPAVHGGRSCAAPGWMTSGSLRSARARRACSAVR